MPYYIKDMLTFMTELILAVSVFVHSRKRRNFFIIRLTVSLIVVVGLQLLYVYILSLFFRAWSTPMVLHMMKYVLALSLCVCAVRVCFDINLKKSIILSVGGDALQNMAYYSRLVTMYFIPTNGMPQYYLTMLIVYFIVYAAVFTLIRKIRKTNLDADVNNIATVIISLSIIVVTIILSSYNTSRDHNVVLYFYAIILDLTLIVMQLGIFRISNHKKEIEMYERILKLENRQREMSKETIELINFKCHNIKHEIAAFMANKDNPANKKEIMEIQDKIAIYSNIARSGNETLDILLTEKGLLCEKNSINFSYIADGQKLKFIDMLDIFNLFGNALDNAIESVSSESSPEKRFINLKVQTQSNLLSIHIENYCNKNLVFVDGLPVTIKDNTDFHGYGTKTIRDIVKKYKGNLMMYLENNIFNLDIMMPLEE